MAWKVTDFVGPVLVVLSVQITCSQCNIVTGVDFVTNLSNNLVPKLFQALAPGRENLVFAPYGLASNLAMLLEATDGNTAQEMRTALNLPADSRELMRIGFKAYSDTFEASSTGLNEEAAGSFNAAMLKSSQRLSSTYISNLVKFFRANITETPSFLNSTGTRATNQTLELRSDSGVMSHWKDYQRLPVFAFLSHQASSPFYRGVNDVIQVPMIPQVGVFRSGKIDFLKSLVLELPLEVNTINLLLVVPDSSDDLDELYIKLSSFSFPYVGQYLTHSEMEVSLPQLAIVTSALDFTPFLRQLGIKEVFNSTSANLRKALKKNGQPMHVKSITQDAFFSTSFVAVNSVGSVSSNIIPKRPKRAAKLSAVVDRPFLFFLVHRDTHLVLLAGKVQNPTQVP